MSFVCAHLWACVCLLEWLDTQPMWLCVAGMPMALCWRAVQHCGGLPLPQCCHAPLLTGWVFHFHARTLGINAHVQPCFAAWPPLGFVLVSFLIDRQCHTDTHVGFAGLRALDVHAVYSRLYPCEQSPCILPT